MVLRHRICLHIHQLSSDRTCALTPQALVKAMDKFAADFAAKLVATVKERVAPYWFVVPWAVCCC